MRLAQLQMERGGFIAGLAMQALDTLSQVEFQRSKQEKIQTAEGTRVFLSE